MRILHIYHDFFANGGVENFIYMLCSSLENNNFDFEVLTTARFINDGFRNSLTKLDIPTYELEKNKESFVKGCFDTAKRIPAFFRKNQYDIVHVHSCSAIQSALLIVLLCRSGVRNIALHSHLSMDGMKGLTKIKNVIKIPLSKLILSHYRIYGLAPSQAAAEYMFPKNMFQKKYVDIVPNAVDAGRFRFNATVRDAIRRKLSIYDDCFLIGNIGRFSLPKNHFFILDIFQVICKKCPNSCLLLVGEGELEKDIKKRVSQLGLEDRVILYGTTNQPEILYQAMDAFLFPSLFEGLGIAAIEAQAAGLPIIVSTTVPKEIAITKQVVWKSLKETAEDWADAVLAVKNIVRKDTYRNIVEHGYDTTVFAREMVTCYQKVLADKNLYRG